MILPKRALTVCVGVSAYPSSILRSGERPLEFLAKSAAALSRLFEEVWPVTTGSKHLLFTDADATLANVKQVISSQAGEYELLVLYLGGHGRGNEDPFQFLFFGDTASAAIGHSSDIDALASLPSASNVVILMDACYSGTYGNETNFLRTSSATSTRVCIASSLSYQRSWEDENFELSIFSHAVAKAFTVEEASKAAPKRLTAEFFDEIASDVTRHAFALKFSAAQEPVMMGSATAALLMPTVLPPERRIASLTTYQTLVRRTRQISLAIVVTAALGVAGLSVATWRPATNGTGLVELRAGPKWLSLLNIGPWKRRVETSIRTTDLRDDDTRSVLLDEQGVHPWPGLNAVHIRRWVDAFLNDFLDEKVAARWRIKLGYANAIVDLTSTGRGAMGATRVVTMQGASQLIAEAKILRPASPLSDLWKLQWNQNTIPGSCLAQIADDVAERYSFYLHLTSPEEFAEWLSELAMIARANDAVGFDEVAVLIEMFSSANKIWKDEYTATLGAPGEPVTAERIAARFEERPSNSEMQALTNLARAIAAGRKTRRQTIVTDREKGRLLALLTDCPDWSASVVASLGSAGDPERVLNWAHGRKTSDQGRAALTQLAAQNALPPNEVEWVLRSVGFAGDDADRKRAFASAREWLRSVAEFQSLSNAVQSDLLRFATRRASLGDTQTARQAIDLIASSPMSRSGIEKADLSAYSTAVDTPFFGPQDRALLGSLALSGYALSNREDNAMMSIAIGSQSGDIDRVIFTEEDKSGPQKTTPLVTGPTFADLLALSRWAISPSSTRAIQADARVSAFLELALADAYRFQVPGSRLRDVIAAAAIVRERSLPDGVIGSNLQGAVKSQSEDAAMRYTQVEIGAAAISLMPDNRREAILDELRSYWRQEQEPEAKLALADMIITATAQVETWTPTIRSSFAFRK